MSLKLAHATPPNQYLLFDIFFEPQNAYFLENAQAFCVTLHFPQQYQTLEVVGVHYELDLSLNKIGLEIVILGFCNVDKAGQYFLIFVPSGVSKP